MISFSDFTAPLSPEAFFADYYGRKPVHIQGGGPGRRELLPWAKFNALMSVGPAWTAQTLKLVRDGTAIGADHYCDRVRTPEGARMIANPAKVKVFLGLGASLVADGIQALSPELQAAAGALSARLGGLTAANAYCSFQGYRGFGAHFDLHEVFAVHTEGEKVWRVYQGRADAPIRFPEMDEESVRAWLDATKGPLLFEARLRPGDVIYIPRGWYHEAMASSAASLHLTFSVAPHTGRSLFPMLEKEALLDRAFRGYLPDARTEGGAALRQHLADLAERLKAVLTSPEFATEVGAEQRILQAPRATYALPQQTIIHYFQATGREATVVAKGRRRLLRTGQAEVELGEAHEAVSWMLGRPAFAFEEVTANFPQFSEATLKAAMELLARAGVTAPV